MKIAPPPSLRITQADLKEPEKIRHRQALINSLTSQDSYPDLFSYSFDAQSVGSKNCENCVGSIEIPVGVAGPVLAHFEHESQRYGEYLYLPLATTEGALVASTSRGAKCITESGGATVLFHRVGMSRSPVFFCESGADAHQFVVWLESKELDIKRLTESTSSHLTFASQQSWIRGRHVYTRFVFDTGDAMGMNMVTIALQYALDILLAEYAESGQSIVSLVSLSSNVCSDKKDSAINVLLGRGWWAQAEVHIPLSVVENCLQVSPEKLVQTHIAKNLVGSNVAGSKSQNMQAANVIAAFYAATGQDIAHVVETAQAFTTMELDGTGLYVAVSVPNINCGVVGGGTGLPAQSQARKLIRGGSACTTQHLVVALAVGILCAEISGLAALSAGTLAKAHEKLGREKKGTTHTHA